MRKAFLTVHLWAGLIAAVFLFLVGISGAIIAFENELDRFLNSGLYYVQPRGHLLVPNIPARRLTGSSRRKSPTWH